MKTAGARLLGLLIALSASVWAARVEAVPVYGVTATGAGSTLVWFDTDTPSASAFTPVTIGAIGPLGAGEEVVAIDFRPANGRLYGVVRASGSGTSRLVLIDPRTGHVTSVGAGTFSLPAGAQVDMDFDSSLGTTSDTLRVVTSTGVNLRVDPATSNAVAGVSLSATYTVAGIAMTSNFAFNNGGTLFGLDTTGFRLVRIGNVNPNDGGASRDGGVVTPIGAFSNPAISTIGFSAFDVTANDDAAFAAIAPTSGSSSLYRINLGSGAATLVGAITGEPLRAMAMLSRASTLYAVNTNNQFVRVLSARPNTALTAAGEPGGAPVAITGLSGGEQVIGLDVRPSTGALYAVTDQGRLYTLDPATAAATLVASIAGATLSESAIGADFDPVADRLRITTENGQSLSINPDTGAAIVDPNLTPVGFSGAAYTNNLAGATATTLFGIRTTGDNPGDDKLVRYNAGTGQVDTIAALPYNLTSTVAFDVAAADGSAFAAFSPVGSTSSGLFVIDLRTGEVRGAGVFGTPLTIAGGVPIRAMTVASNGVVRFGAPSYTVQEAPSASPGVQALLSLQRVGGGDGPLTVTVTTTAGSAQEGVDYLPVDVTLTWAAGDTADKTVLVAFVPNDSAPEPDKTFTATISPSSPNAGLGVPSTAVVVIHDDDAPAVSGAPTIHITTPTADPSYTATSLFLTLAGTAADSDGTIQSVTWVNDRGYSGTASSAAAATSEWFANVVPLAAGLNTITVTATDNSGKFASATIAVTVDKLTYYLAEGATSSFFTTEILLANPNPQPAAVSLQFLNESGPLFAQDRVLPASSHTTIKVNDLPGLAQAGGLSTIVTSDAALPIVVERTMTWNERGYGSATDHASDGVNTTWYFAEGAQGFYFTYILLANPNDAPNVAHVTYFRENESPVSKDYPLAPRARLTIDVSGEPELQTRAFGTQVTFDLPGVAERSMYFGMNPLWTGGHESGGVNVPSRSWFLAEGATGTYFTTFVLFTNPTNQDATVDVTYLPAFGPTVPKRYTVPAQGRYTVNIAGEDPTLAAATVATSVQSDVPILVERSQYWPGGPATWREAHNAFGVSEAGTSWGLSEGRVGGPAGYQSYILIANPGDTPATVNIKFLREDGRPPLVLDPFTVNAHSRFTVFGDLPVDQLQNENFGAVITSSQPIVVERAMYSDGLGVHWEAGSNATATRLPPLP